MWKKWAFFWMKLHIYDFKMHLKTPVFDSVKLLLNSRMIPVWTPSYGVSDLSIRNQNKIEHMPMMHKNYIRLVRRGFEASLLHIPVPLLLYLPLLPCPHFNVPSNKVKITQKLNYIKYIKSQHWHSYTTLKHLIMIQNLLTYCIKRL